MSGLPVIQPLYRELRNSRIRPSFRQLTTPATVLRIKDLHETIKNNYRLKAELNKSSILIALWAAANLGCAVSSESSIIGRYTASAPCLTANLLVNADHSYIQRIDERSGGTREVKGRWHLDQKSGLITFERLLSLTSPNPDRAGLSAFQPERVFRRIIMGPDIVRCQDSDYEVDYVKQ